MVKVRKMKRNILLLILILLFLQGCGYTFVPADRWRNTQANLAQCKKDLTECQGLFEECETKSAFQEDIIKAQQSAYKLGNMYVQVSLYSAVQKEQLCQQELEDLKATCEGGM